MLASPAFNTNYILHSKLRSTTKIQIYSGKNRTKSSLWLSNTITSTAFITTMQSLPTSGVKYSVAARLPSHMNGYICGNITHEIHGS